MSKALVVIDYQVDLVSGSLGFNDSKTLENNIYRKIRKYKEDGEDVIFTYDTHDEKYGDTQEASFTPTRHCIKGSIGWSLYGKIDEIWDETDKAFCKNTFGSLELANYLRSRNYSSVEFVGVLTNICILANAVLAKSALPEAKVTVDATCVASNDRVLNEEAFDVMEEMQIYIENRDKIKY